MSSSAEWEDDGSGDGGGEGPAKAKRARKPMVHFSDALKTLLGKTIHESYKEYHSVLVKGTHDKGPAMARLVVLINQHLARENPHKEWSIDKRILFRWITTCIDSVAEWRAEADMERKDGGDKESGADNKEVAEHKQVWMELQSAAENEIAVRKEQALSVGNTNYKSPSKPAEALDKDLTLMQGELGSLRCIFRRISLRIVNGKETTMTWFCCKRYAQPGFPDIPHTRSLASSGSRFGQLSSCSTVVCALIHPSVIVLTIFNTVPASRDTPCVHSGAPAAAARAPRPGSALRGGREPAAAEKAAPAHVVSQRRRRRRRLRRRRRRRGYCWCRA